MPQQKILVVDDDIRLQRLMQAVLQRAGYRVVLASTGEEGIHLVTTEQPDLVLMDVMMPGIDGFEAIKRIRRLPEGREVPIVLLSAMSEVEAKVKGLRVGGDDYITKPVKMSELLARIQARLRPASAALGQLITVFGGQAGVGATTVTLNLGLALRKVTQSDVLLLDWQRPLGGFSFCLGLPEVQMLELILPNLDDLDSQVFNKTVKEVLPGVKVLLGLTERAFASQMGPASLKKMTDMALTQARYVLVDAGAYFDWPEPPLTGQDEGLNLCVLTPELPATQRASKALRDADARGHRLWPVLNRDGVPGGLPYQQIEARLEELPKGRLPESSYMIQALNDGHPLYTTGLSPDFVRAVEELASHIHNTLSA
ncbi:MAG: response regulator [Chloroflexota bacterium]